MAQSLTSKRERQYNQLVFTQCEKTGSVLSAAELIFPLDTQQCRYFCFGKTQQIRWKSRRRLSASEVIFWKTADLEWVQKKNKTPIHTKHKENMDANITLHYYCLFNGKDWPKLGQHHFLKYRLYNFWQSSHIVYIEVNFNHINHANKLIGIKYYFWKLWCYIVRAMESKI